MKLDLSQTKRISIVGISASGKSTLACKLAQKTGINVYHMDSLYWRAGWIEVPEDEWRAKETEIYNQDQWILEGYIAPSHCGRLKHSDLIIYLDMPALTCAINYIKRWWHYKGKSRPDLAGCNERFSLSFLWTIYKRKERADIENAIALNNQKTILRVSTKSALHKFLDDI